MTVATATVETANGHDPDSLIQSFTLVGSFFKDDRMSDSLSLPTKEETDTGTVTKNLLISRVEPFRRSYAQPVGHIHTAEEMRCLRHGLERLFSEAAEESFIDGMQSTFSAQLIASIQKHGDAAMNQIILMVEDDEIAPEVLAETLRWFGHMENGPGYSRRRWLLEQCLTAPNVTVRDGAILGLSFLEDPRSIPALERAYQHEEHDILRVDIRQVIEDLEDLHPLVANAKILS